MSTSVSFPAAGQAKAAVLSQMEAARQQDVKWQAGRVFSLVFDGGDDVEAVLHEAYALFFAENGLNPTAFPSLRRFETEVVGMVADLLGGDSETVGNMTSGGTESILMAVKTARDWARAHHPAIALPEMVLPLTAHPAFDKAGQYFGVRVVHAPVCADFRADIEAMRRAITPNTILLVGSAPSYPQGVVDPIAGIAALAREHDLLCHVDACVGGMMLPFVRKLGYPIPNFDFRVPGVTSISVDLHKYGYAAKGASVLLYRDKATRRHQLFAAMDWPGGIYASPTMTGTRPGGAIAAAWAVMRYLGADGYMRIAEQVMQAVARIQKGVQAIDGVRVLSNPEMSVMALVADRLNIYEIGDEMTLRGWHLDRQQRPPSLHLTVNYAHVKVVDSFLADLTAAVAQARRPHPRRFANAALQKSALFLTRALPERWVSRLMGRVGGMLGGGDGLPGRSAAMYGMMGSLPNRGDLKELVFDLVESFTAPMQDGND